MHHEQDMRYYGALRREIPVTFWAMLAGTLAITGVGIYGIGGFAGFHSKDAILKWHSHAALTWQPSRSGSAPLPPC
jgi:NADH-quinone oxidoreductase subunit L